MAKHPMLVRALLLAVVACVVTREADAQGGRITPRVAVAGRDPAEHLDLMLQVGRSAQGSPLPAQYFQLVYCLANPFSQFVRVGEPLRLTPAQVDTIEALAAQFDGLQRAVWRPLYRQLGSLPASYDIQPVWRHVTAAYDTTFAMLRPWIPAALSELTDDQRRLLTPTSRALLDTAALEKLRPRRPAGSDAEVTERTGQRCGGW